MLFADPTVVLFNDTSAWYHCGCTGTSVALKEEIRKTGFEIQAFPINVTYSLKEVPPFEEFDTIPFQRLEIFAEIMYPFTQFLEDQWQLELVFGQKSKDLNFL